ncbi:MAG: hypothetical protein J7499_18695 [Sphingopyxis sp.]|nr:hypothetical protein [Sphingopyxis sp.]
MDAILVLTALVAACTLGGGLYEFIVVDAVWPDRPDIVSPRHGGLSRKRFWIVIHVAFELLLVASLVTAWSTPEVRNPLLIALASHGAMRIWSALDFIPKALAFERMEPQEIPREAARRWVSRSKLRFPLDLITMAAVAAALAAALAR